MAGCLSSLHILSALSGFLFTDNMKIPNGIHNKICWFIQYAKIKTKYSPCEDCRMVFNHCLVHGDGEKTNGIAVNICMSPSGLEIRSGSEVGYFPQHIQAKRS